MEALRNAIAGQVRALFNDRATPATVVARDGSGLFTPDAVCWRVHGDVTSMLVGGVSALLLQMLHPGALAGVWDHSNFREDMTGRLRNTARFIARTTYGPRADALAAMDRVKAIHDRVTGTLPDGTPYRANDPHLLAWVHVTEAVSFLAAYRRYVEPGMSAADQDRYFAEAAIVAEALGTDPAPRGRAEAAALMRSFRPELKVDERTREVARFLLDQRASTLALMPLQAMTFGAGVELLPDWARAMHGLSMSELGRPLLRAGTFGMASTLRWALRR